MSDGEEPEAGPRLKWSGLTDVGRIRKNNEDAFLAVTVDAKELKYLGKIGEGQIDSGDFIFAVSDGMGGASAGEFASRIAVDKLTHMLPQSFKMAAAGLDRGCSEILREILEQIHDELRSMGRHYEECRGMGATFSICWFTPGIMHFAHIGDSRIYYIPKDEDWVQLTEDHTVVARLLRLGRITRYEAMIRDDRNILEQALGGSTMNIDPQIGTVRYQPGDRFVLCTDGVTDGISGNRVSALVKSPPARFEAMNIAERLVTDALEESGKDNTTAIAVELGL